MFFTDLKVYHLRMNNTTEKFDMDESGGCVQLYHEIENFQI